MTKLNMQDERELAKAIKVLAIHTTDLKIDARNHEERVRAHEVDDAVMFLMSVLDKVGA